MFKQKDERRLEMDLSNFVLNNGLKIPSIGFGTWELPEGEKTACAVKNAISVGYKHIDTAAAYENERSIAEGIRQSGARREDVFVTSKVWLTSMGYEKTLLSFKETLSELDTDYLDLLLIHVPAVESMVEQWQRLNLSTWKAMEHLYKEGYVKAVVVPILKPVIATVTIFNVIYNWNEFPFAVTYISSSVNYTISLATSMFKGAYSRDYSAMIAAAVLIMIPQLIFYALLQKQIIAGMTEGAVKA